MIFIVDSNIVFAALLKDSTSRLLLTDKSFTFYSPETMLNEIRKYENEIIKRSGLSKYEFEELFSLITDNIRIIEKEKYTDFINDADKLIGNIDKGDVPFLALALSISNDGIWTENAKDFKHQNKIKIWSTKEILNDLIKIN